MSSKAIFNLAYINGQYGKEDQMKNSYHSVGSAFLREKDNKDIFSVKLESYPPIGKNIYAFEKVEENKEPVLDKSKTKVFNVCVPNGRYAKGDNVKISYHKVGVAYLGDKGLSMRLFSLPFTNKNNECWLNLFEVEKKENTNINDIPTVDPKDAFDAPVFNDDVEPQI